MNTAALTALLSGDIDNAMVAITPRGIERQEEDGQRALVESTMIPKEIRGVTREQLENIGFKFGDDVDDLFVQCELPPGWTKRATSHSMHSDILDDQGRLRANIFYKAAFYDRRADLRMVRRFNVNEFLDGSQHDHLRCAVTDGDVVVFEAGEWKRMDYDHCAKLELICKDWLNAEHPGWESPMECWQ